MSDGITVREYPLAGPYSFEGVTSPEETLAEISFSIELEGILDTNAVAVIRAGENNYGTWGYIFTWDGSQFIHQGYTLERRSSVGKGPIPLGDFAFNRWISPRLGKTLRLHNVPGFTDILIHVGNTESETQGCILAAKNVDRLENPTSLRNSRTLTDWLYDSQSAGTVYVRSR